MYSDYPRSQSRYTDYDHESKNNKNNNDYLLKRLTCQAHLCYISSS